MNLVKLKPTEWLVVAGGVIVMIFGLFKWFSWDVRDDNVLVVSDQSNAFDYLLTGVLPWVLVIGAAAVTLLLATENLRRDGIPWPLVILAATVLAAVLVIIRLIVGYDPGPRGGAEADVSRGIGLWLSAAGALVAAVGAFLSYQAGAFEKRITTPSNPPPPRPDREIPPPVS